MLREELRNEIAKLHRRVSFLEGKPDPGLPCPKCENGRIDLTDDYGDRVGSTLCLTCNGSGRVYPKEGTSGG